MNNKIQHLKSVVDGVYEAQCVKVTDLGMQKVAGKMRQVERFTFQITAKHSGIIEKDYTVLTSPGSNRRRHLESWMGRSFTPEEIARGFDSKQMIGKPCRLSIRNHWISPKIDKILPARQAPTQSAATAPKPNATDAPVAPKPSATGQAAAPKAEETDEGRLLAMLRKLLTNEQTETWSKAKSSEEAPTTPPIEEYCVRPSNQVAAKLIRHLRMLRGGVAGKVVRLFDLRELGYTRTRHEIVLSESPKAAIVEMVDVESKQPASFSVLLDCQTAYGIVVPCPYERVMAKLYSYEPVK